MMYSAQKSYDVRFHISRWWALVVFGFSLTGLLSNALAQPAFPGAQGFGADTIGGRGGIVILVTNTNDSGAGSLREALLTETPRTIVFRVSGTIALETPISLGAAHSFVTVAGQTAPGDGIAIKGPENGISLELSYYSSGDAPGIFHDGIFQHLRFRHGSPVVANSSNTDNIAILPGTYNVIFDHNSFTWGGDEVLSTWGSDQRDITFSWNIFSEGVVFCKNGVNGSEGQNVGPLMSGGAPQSRFTFHHNLLSHMCYRNFKLDAGSGGITGMQFINNVHYNNFAQEYHFDQNLYTGPTAVMPDVIGDYFKSGPDSADYTWPVTLARATDGTYADISLHFVNSTWRDVNGDPHPGNNEADNYQMISIQDFGQLPTWQKRSSPLSQQPPYPVAIETASDAYNSVLSGAGASKPAYDAVDTRLLNDPRVGGSWSESNIPAPRGSASYPNLLTYDVPVDTDNDGVPNSYETSVLGSDPLLADSVQDHDGDGYTNIEEFIHSIPGQSGSPNPAMTKPNPPSNFASNN